MKNFGTALKRALDANGRLPSELAKAAGVTGNAVARWLKCIPFQRKKTPRKIIYLRGVFLLATVWLPSCPQGKVYGRRRILAYPSIKKSPTAPTVGLRGRALTGQGKENKAMETYYNQLAAGK